MLADIKKLNRYYKIYRFIKSATKFEKIQYLFFRADFINEELQELYQAIEEEQSDEIVDALIDIIVVALGTLDAFDIDIKTAWKRVHDANMQKTIGIKKSRPNPLGLPDLIKPADWEAPQHIDNVGKLNFLNKE